MRINHWQRSYLIQDLIIALVLWQHQLSNTQMIKPRVVAGSNQQVSGQKRKRAGTSEAFASVNNGFVVTLPHHERAIAPRSKNSTSRQEMAASVSLDSSALIGNPIQWPEHLKKLRHTHRALNLVYTFCCTRKHLATTFENLKTAVEGHIQRELLIQDIAQIKALVPEAIHFGHVDALTLQVAILGDGDDIRRARTYEYGDTKLPNAFSEDENTSPIAKSKALLLFEFIDEDLKRQVSDAKTGAATNPSRRLREEDLKIPVYSQKQMTKLIEKRNRKFDSAVTSFMNRCAVNGIDTVEELCSIGEKYLPIATEKPSSTAPMRKPLESMIPLERQTVAQIIDEIKCMEWYTGQIVPDGHRVFEAREAIFGDLNFQLSQNIVDALFNIKNITRLYSHQAEAINNLYEGYNVIISTSTSSGKSLIYQIPMLHELELDSNSRGMYIFPTKALAQDQKRSMKELLDFMPGLEDLIVNTFDGDTTIHDRDLIRENGRIIFTNPDMLHITILPQEEKWRTFFQNLKLVVVDELHVYNGLFGSHVALIMRRLQRICAAYGNRHIKFISCSATVANPEEHMRAIYGIDKIRLTESDGSPSGRKEFICWNTPFKDPLDPSSGRGDVIAGSAKLFCQLILRDVRVIAFCRVRKQCEILIRAVRAEALSLDKGDIAARIMGYRGGYAPQDRRRIEKEMFEGKLLGIVATNALELGVDIGTLDAVITVGFPYTIANLRQQSGRAGRRNKDSLSVLIGDSFPTDQYYMDNPDEIFTKPNCKLLVDLENMLVLDGHIQCAAFEMPIRPQDDKVYFGEQLLEIAEKRLVKDSVGFYHCNDRFRPCPSKFVNIRDTEDGHFVVIDVTEGRNTVLEEVEPSRAFFTIYEGGIFLHQGETFLVREFAPELRMAKVSQVKVDWTTQQRDYTDIDPIETEAIRRIPNSLSRAFYGVIKVRAVVFGYFKVDKRKRILDAVQVDNPPIEILSKGMWLDVPKSALDILKSRRMNIAGAIHAAEHAILSLMPQFVMSMPGEVRTECKVALKEFAKKETARKRPARVTFYDAKGGAGGSGISTKAFEFIDVLLMRACDRVGSCHCLEGCLECVCGERCKGQNAIISKAGGEVILKSLLGREGDICIDTLPWGEEGLPAGVETVCEAEEIRPARGRKLDII